MGKNKSIGVVIDTNLWISFLIGKRMAFLVPLLENSKIQIFSTYLLKVEILSVSQREKFNKYFSSEDVKWLESWMDSIVSYVDLQEIPSRCRDPKDDYLLELAIKSNASYLVTGDDDLLAMGSVGDCKITKIGQFEQEIQEKFRDSID